MSSFLQRICEQVEFYFGRLPEDRHMRHLLEMSPDETIALEDLLKFQKLRNVQLEPRQLIRALHRSTVLQLTPDEKRCFVKERGDMLSWLLANDPNQYVDRTVYLEPIPRHWTRSQLQALLERALGPLSHVDLPTLSNPPKQSNRPPTPNAPLLTINRGFAFVEFLEVEAVGRCVPLLNTFRVPVHQRRPLMVTVTVQGTKETKESKQKGEGDAMMDDPKKEEEQEGEEKREDQERTEERPLDPFRDVPTPERVKALSQMDALVWLQHLNLWVLSKKDWLHKRQQYLHHLSQKRQQQGILAQLRLQDINQNLRHARDTPTPSTIPTRPVPSAMRSPDCSKHVIAHFQHVHPQTNRDVLTNLFHRIAPVFHVDYTPGETQGYIRFLNPQSTQHALLYFHQHAVYQLSCGDAQGEIAVVGEDDTVKEDGSTSQPIQLRALSEPEESQYWCEWISHYRQRALVLLGDDGTVLTEDQEDNDDGNHEKKEFRDTPDMKRVRV